MLEIDELSLNAITSAIDETIQLIEENKDIRIVASSLGNVSNKIRAMSEIKETPDNEFVSFIFTVLSFNISESFKDKEEEWFELNKELCNQCVNHVKNLLQGMKKSLMAKNFEETMDVFKTAVFTLMQALSRMSD